MTVGPINKTISYHYSTVNIRLHFTRAILKLSLPLWDIAKKIYMIYNYFWNEMNNKFHIWQDRLCTQCGLCTQGGVFAFNIRGATICGCGDERIQPMWAKHTLRFMKPLQKCKSPLRNCAILQMVWLPFPSHFTLGLFSPSYNRGAENIKNMRI